MIRFLRRAAVTGFVVWAAFVREPASNQPADGMSAVETVEVVEAPAGVPVVVPADVPYAAEFDRAGTAHGVDPALLAAVAFVESSYQLDARSGAGAMGLMQFMPETAEEMGVDPWDPVSAIDGAARYLANSYRIHGDWPVAIAAYNAGNGAVTRRGIAAAEGDYVNKVLSKWG